MNVVEEVFNDLQQIIEQSDELTRGLDQVVHERLTLEDELRELELQLQMEEVQDAEVHGVMKDPRTGRSNEEYRKLRFQQRCRENPRYVELRERLRSLELEDRRLRLWLQALRRRLRAREPQARLLTTVESSP